MSLSRETDRLRAPLTLLLSALVLMTLGGCAERDGGAPPVGGMSTPSASFSRTVTSGEPGLVVEFSDTSTGAIDSRLWDFGDGRTSPDPNPVVEYMIPGVYSVSLTVEGGRGTSVAREVDLVQIDGMPRAGFVCDVVVGFAPITTTCTNGGSAPTITTEYLWDFGDGTTSAEESPSHVYTTPGDYVVTQTVSTAAGTAVASTTIEALPLAITVVPLIPGNTGPGEYGFFLDAGGYGGMATLWRVDGVIRSTLMNDVITLREPGTHSVSVSFVSTEPALIGMATAEVVVSFAPPTAAFLPSTDEGAGPLSVVMIDESIGDVIAWEWSFGDGSTCDFPVLISSATLCDAASPTHVYNSMGSFDVSLKVTANGENPGDSVLEADVMTEEAVRVTVLDPSFEEQGVGTAIAGAWTSLRPASAAQAGVHLALSSAQGGADGGMPTEGAAWAVIDGRETDGSDPALLVANGIQTQFIKPRTDTVLEFDYALLYSEPTLSGTLDEMTATVTDGASTVEVVSARADTQTPYAGSSARFPTLDGSTTRATGVQTASLDLATAFPGADADTVFTLTIRLTNSVNAFRSPRAYVDGIRFTSVEASFVTAFALEENPVIVGEAVSFTDETCLDPVASACSVPTSWRWDFDSHLSSTSPAATGSSDQNPTAIFPESGEYQVTLLARHGDQESEATMSISVIGAPEAGIEAVFSGATQAPATIVFTDVSSFDASDPIVSWDWDFGGFGFASTQGPHTIVIPQSGNWTIRLTVTTASGLESTATTVLSVD